MNSSEQQSASDSTWDEFDAHCKSHAYSISDADSNRCTMVIRMVTGMHAQFISAVVSILNTTLPNATLCHIAMKHVARVAVAVQTRYMRLKHSQTLLTMFNSISSTTKDQYLPIKENVLQLLKSLAAQYKPLYNEELQNAMSASGIDGSTAAAADDAVHAEGEPGSSTTDPAGAGAGAGGSLPISEDGPGPD